MSPSAIQSRATPQHRCRTLGWRPRSYSSLRCPAFASPNFFIVHLIDHLQASIQVLSLAKALSIQAHPDRDLAQPKKNRLDYLFHLYEQCHIFLLHVQTIAKMGGHKSPTKVYFA
jgi:hypothetical protein